jgi:4,5-DOPA dioxygenase extradiol
MKNDLVIRDAAREAQKLVLLIHGVGSSPSALKPLGERLASLFSSATVIALCAPNVQVTDKQFEWFSVNGVTEENRIERIKGAMPSFIASIEYWQEFTGVSVQNTVLVGFSQGAIMALESMKFRTVAGSIVAIAGRFGRLIDVENTSTNVLLLHGERDLVFPYYHAVDGARALVNKGVAVKIELVPNMGHEINPDALERIEKYLMSRFSVNSPPSALRMPSLFISHGAPTYALEPNIAGPQLGALGAMLQPKAVLILSPHWMTKELAVSTVAIPKTIHDFGGFPEPLYRLQYPADGSPEYALKALDLFRAAGIPAVATDSYGLDHGAWVPMMHLFSQAQYPVFQVSMPARLNIESAYALGIILKPLRDEGVLIIGSGSLTHNLYEIERDNPQAAQYVKDFQAWIRDKVVRADVASLLASETKAPDFKRAHPTAEHFLPLLFAAGAGGFEGAIDVLEGGIEHHVLSMESYVFDA